MKYSLANVAWPRAAIVGLVAAAGCSGAAPYGVTPVSGKITYEDGSIIPAEEMILNFRSMEAPKDPKTHPRTGMCRVNVADGTFDYVTTYQHADGAIAGRHKVSIALRAKNGTKVVPEEYTSEATTPLVVDTSDAPFSFLVRKPGDSASNEAEARRGRSGAATPAGS